MRIKANNLIAIRHFFEEELSSLYPLNEIRHYFYWCCESLLGLSKIQVINDPEYRVSESMMLKFNTAVKELRQHKPIQYICQSCDFYNLNLSINPSALIPRPETEELVSWIINDLQEQKPLAILDICTGSGCIALALKKNISDIAIDAIDISENALELAKENAKKHQLDIHFSLEDILSYQTEKTYDVIVSNPPYVRNSEKKDMQKNVLDYEPEIALFVADEDPLIFYNVIADFARKQLNPNGRLYLEINENLYDETAELLRSKGFQNIEIKKDFRDKYRMIKCQNQ